MMTHVINVKKENLKKNGFKDFEDWNIDDDHIYIGRNMNFYVKGTFDSKWKNPYTVKKYGREKCLEMYKEYVKNGPLYNSLEELYGKELGCWCKPEKCHGDILIELLNEKMK